MVQHLQDMFEAFSRAPDAREEKKAGKIRGKEKKDGNRDDRSGEQAENGDIVHLIVILGNYQPIDESLRTLWPSCKVDVGVERQKAIT
jgi:hypothetical protein